MADDEFSSGIPDEALGAALDAVERAAQPRVSRGAGATSAIIVSTRQKGNPILSHIKNVPWEYGPSTLATDYLLSTTTCALFLSLKYHKLHPDYIFTRLRTLGTAFTLRVLLVLVDVADHTDVLRALTKTCVLNNLTLFLAWSAAEAGRYLETFKSCENTPPTLIMEKVAEDYGTRMSECFTRVRGVNKTDAVTLVSTFGSVRAAINASPEEVMMISGWGQQKVARLDRAVRDPFRVGKKTDRGKGKSRALPPSSEVAQRLGIDTPEQTKAPEVWTIGDDEDALRAVQEYEEEEERLRGEAATRARVSVVREGSTRPEQVLLEDVPPDVGECIMQALAKMRENEG